MCSRRSDTDSSQQIWRTVTNLTKDADAANAVRGHLLNINKALIDESRVSKPHTCMQFAAESQIYIPVAKIATTSYNESIIHQALRLFGTLIDGEEEEFLQSTAFSQALMNLMLRITGANSLQLSLDTEVEVVQLAFSIAAKIRLDPEILAAWFETDDESSEDDDLGHHERFAGKTSKDDFPLFYLLIDYIHHEGRAGDFARTGLLYIIESASTSISLERWLVESDLATLMATGLGALYSQLSRKLVIDYSDDNFPPILLLSDYKRPRATADIVSSASPDFLSHMETFLSHLLFWQDVLDHCKSQEVKQTLLEHFQVIFLQQLLYPSLLESSDVDGGSSVAVITYLRRVLEAIEHPDLIHLILHYLLALPDMEMLNSVASIDTLASKARKRKSISLSTMAPHQSTPDLFNLVDLIINSLQSKNAQTTTVTLQLLSVIVRRHHRHAITTLLKTTRVADDAPRKTVGAHEAEHAYLLDLAAQISESSPEEFDATYSDHITDATGLIESHTCNFALIAPAGVELPSEPAASLPGAPPSVQRHTLKSDDQVLKTLVGHMERWFGNSVETNLALTEAIVDLAICGFMDLEEWLLPDASSYTYQDSSPATAADIGKAPKSDSSAALELEQIAKLRKARLKPVVSKATLPPLLNAIKDMVQKVDEYRDNLPRFDELLQARRVALEAAPPEPSSDPSTDEKALQKQLDEDRPKTSLEIMEGGWKSMSAENSQKKAFENVEKKLLRKTYGIGPGAVCSIGHILTNVVILQGFVIELAALVQVRAGLLREVRYV